MYIHSIHAHSNQTTYVCVIDKFNTYYIMLVMLPILILNSNKSVIILLMYLVTCVESLYIV